MRRRRQWIVLLPLVIRSEMADLRRFRRSLMLVSVTGLVVMRREMVRQLHQMQHPPIRSITGLSNKIDSGSFCG